jgi:RNA polymerase-interacting CarD/CdnL/TRCF family regulator
MSANPLQAGDRVYHPMYGFGKIESVAVRDQADYYGIRLSDGTVLSVPVKRAETVGLRPVINGLASIAAGLRSTARPLPDDDRQRALELKARWQASNPVALTQAVRDLLSRGRSSHLTPADKRWLTNACERLSTEAALVDEIAPTEARAAIQQEIDRFKIKLPTLQPAI